MSSFPHSLIGLECQNFKGVINLIARSWSFECLNVWLEVVLALQFEGMNAWLQGPLVMFIVSTLAKQFPCFKMLFLQALAFPKKKNAIFSPF